MNNIQLPDARNELLYTLRDLSDLEYQEREWLDDKFAHAFWDSLFMIRGFLYDDRGLKEDPESEIGYTIRNQKEVELIKSIIAAIDKLYNEIGHDRPDDAYWNTPLWLEVVEKARAAYDYIKAQGKDNEYINWIEELEAKKQVEYDAKIKQE